MLVAFSSGQFNNIFQCFEIEEDVFVVVPKKKITNYSIYQFIYWNSGIKYSIENNIPEKYINIISKHCSIILEFESDEDLFYFCLKNNVDTNSPNFRKF